MAINTLSTFELSNNNKWRRQVQHSTGALTAQVGWLGLKVGGCSVLSVHLSNELGELTQWLCHDDRQHRKHWCWHY